MTTQQTELDTSSFIDARGRLIVPARDDEAGWKKVEALPARKVEQFQALAEATSIVNEAEAALREADRLVPIALAHLGAMELALQKSAKGISPLAAFRAQEAAEARERGIKPPKGAEKVSLVSPEDQEKHAEAQRQVTNAREGLRIAQVDAAKAREAVKAARKKKGQALVAFLGLVTPDMNARHYIKSAVAERAASRGKPSATTPRQTPSPIDAHLAGYAGQPGVRSTRQAQRGAFPSHMRGRSILPSE